MALRILKETKTITKWFQQNRDFRKCWSPKLQRHMYFLEMDRLHIVNKGSRFFAQTQINSWKGL